MTDRDSDRVSDRESVTDRQAGSDSQKGRVSDRVSDTQRQTDRDRKRERGCAEERETETGRQINSARVSHSDQSTCKCFAFITKQTADIAEAVVKNGDQPLICIIVIVCAQGSLAACLHSLYRTFLTGTPRSSDRPSAGLQLSPYAEIGLPGKGKCAETNHCRFKRACRL